MSTLLTVARDKDGKEVGIEEVAHGKACNCFCPSCKKPLIAKNSIPRAFARRAHHFAHQKGCLCETNDETVLHQLAKEIIKEEKSLMLPQSKSGSRPSGIVHFRSVEVEKWDDLYKFRPDTEAITEDGERILIEFLVTHEVSQKKRRIIIENNLRCLEVDLNFVEPRKDAVRRFLLSETEERKWIEPIEKKANSGALYAPYPRNPMHYKIIELIRAHFESRTLYIKWDGIDYNFRDLGYDICEPSKVYRRFKSDLLMIRSKEETKGEIAVSVRGRRRNDGHKTPRGLRVIDIVVRGDWVYERMKECENLYFAVDGDTMIFEGFKHKDA